MVKIETFAVEQVFAPAPLCEAIANWKSVDGQV